MLILSSGQLALWMKPTGVAYAKYKRKSNHSLDFMGACAHTLRAKLFCTKHMLGRVPRLLFFVVDGAMDRLTSNVCFCHHYALLHANIMMNCRFTSVAECRLALSDSSGIICFPGNNRCYVASFLLSRHYIFIICLPQN